MFFIRSSANENVSRLDVNSDSSLLGSKYPVAIPQAGSSNQQDKPWEKRLCLDQDTFEKFNNNRYPISTVLILTFDRQNLK